MAATLSQNNLKKKQNSIDSQKIFWNYLDIEKINVLIHLFDEASNSTSESKYTITELVKEERRSKGLSDANINVVSYVYGVTENTPTLHLQIIKNNQDFLHFTIHLTVFSLDNKNSGPIHFKHDIYKVKGLTSKNKLPYRQVPKLRTL